MSAVTKPSVPDGLRDLMKDLVREILKEKSTDLYDFAENYFHARLNDKENYAVISFEQPFRKYDFSSIKHPQRYQFPVGFVNSIMPESLTKLIKDLIKAVLREQPHNLCEFALEYFRHLKNSKIHSEAVTKDINYTTYENYCHNKQLFHRFSSYVQCTCGRTLSESCTKSLQYEQWSPKQTNESANKKTAIADIEAHGSFYSAKYIAAIYKIQHYFRRYLNRKLITCNKETKNTIERCEQYDSTNRAVLKFELKGSKIENNLKDISHKSVSTPNNLGREINVSTNDSPEQANEHPKTENDTNSFFLDRHQSGFNNEKNLVIKDKDTNTNIRSTKNYVKTIRIESCEIMTQTLIESTLFEKELSDLENDDIENQIKSQVNKELNNENKNSHSLLNDKKEDQEPDPTKYKINEKNTSKDLVENEEDQVDSKNVNIDADLARTKNKSNLENFKTELSEQGETGSKTAIEINGGATENKKGVQTEKESKEMDEQEDNTKSDVNIFEVENDIKNFNNVDAAVDLTEETNGLKEAILHFKSKENTEETESTTSEEEIDLREQIKSHLLPFNNFLEKTLDLQLKIEPHSVKPETEKEHIDFEETKLLKDFKDADYVEMGEKNVEKKSEEFEVKRHSAEEKEDLIARFDSTSKLDDCSANLNGTSSSVYFEKYKSNIVTEGEKEIVDQTDQTKKDQLHLNQHLLTNNNEIQNKKNLEDINIETVNDEVSKFYFGNSDLKKIVIRTDDTKNKTTPGDIIHSLVHDQEIGKAVNETNSPQTSEKFKNNSNTLKEKLKENTDLDIHCKRETKHKTGKCAGEINETIKNEKLVDGFQPIKETDEKGGEEKDEYITSRLQHNSKLISISAPTDIKSNIERLEHSSNTTTEYDSIKNKRSNNYSLTDFDSKQKSSSPQSEKEMLEHDKRQDKSNVFMASDTSDLAVDSSLEINCPPPQTIMPALQHESSDESTCTNLNTNKFQILNNFSQKKVEESDKKNDLSNKEIEHVEISYQSSDTSDLNKISNERISPNEQHHFYEDQDSDSTLQKEIDRAHKETETPLIFKRSQEDVAKVNSEDENEKVGNECKETLLQPDGNIINTNDCHTFKNELIPVVENISNESQSILTETNTQLKLHPKILPSVVRQEKVLDNDLKEIFENTSGKTIVEQLEEKTNECYAEANKINLCESHEQNKNLLEYEGITKHTSSKTLIDLTKEVSDSIAEASIDILKLHDLSKDKNKTTKCQTDILTEELPENSTLIKEEGGLHENIIVAKLLVDENIRDIIEELKLKETNEFQQNCEVNDQNTFIDTIFPESQSDEKYENKTEDVQCIENKDLHNNTKNIPFSNLKETHYLLSNKNSEMLEPVQLKEPHLLQNNFELCTEGHQTSDLHTKTNKPLSSKDNKKISSLDKRLENPIDNELSKQMNKRVVENVDPNILKDTTNHELTNEYYLENSVSPEEFYERDTISLADQTAERSINDQLQTKLQIETKQSNNLNQTERENNKNETSKNFNEIENTISDSNFICHSPKQKLKSPEEDKINSNLRNKTFNENIKLNQSTMNLYDKDVDRTAASNDKMNVKILASSESENNGGVYHLEICDDSYENHPTLKAKTDEGNKVDLKLIEMNGNNDDAKKENLNKQNDETDAISCQTTIIPNKLSNLNKNETMKTKPNDENSDNYHLPEGNADQGNPNARSLNKPLASTTAETKPNEQQQNNPEVLAARELENVKEHFETEYTTQPFSTNKESGYKVDNHETINNIGNQTSEKLYIGNQNLVIGRIGNFSKGLIGSISGQRFAETHLRSFWKEYLMNNCEPLSEYKYIENEQTQFAEQAQISNPDDMAIELKGDPLIIKEELLHWSYFNNEFTLKVKNQPKDIERLPSYFYGAFDLGEQKQHAKTKFFKEPVSFIIPFGESNNYSVKQYATIDAINSNNESVMYKKNNFTKFNLTGGENIEAVPDCEKQSGISKDLTKFEYENCNFDTDNILKDDDELTIKPILHTIYELIESDLPKAMKMTESIDDEFVTNVAKISESEGTSWTTESKDENSFTSDELLEDQNNNNNGKHENDMTSKFEDKTQKQGGIYEFSEDTYDQQSKLIAHTSFEEDLKVAAAKLIQNFFRHYKHKQLKSDTVELSNQHSLETTNTCGETKDAVHAKTKIYTNIENEILLENQSKFISFNTIDTSKHLVDKSGDNKEIETHLDLKNNCNSCIDNVSVYASDCQEVRTDQQSKQVKQNIFKEEPTSNQISDYSEGVTISERKQKEPIFLQLPETAKNEKLATNVADEMVKVNCDSKIEQADIKSKNENLKNSIKETGIANDLKETKWEMSDHMRQQILNKNDLKDQSARKIQQLIRKYLNKKSENKTKHKPSKTFWFIGDEKVIASEIPCEETKACIDSTTNPSKYLANSNSSVKSMDASNLSRSPTAPVSSGCSTTSLDLTNNFPSNISKDPVTDSDVDVKSDACKLNTYLEGSCNNDGLEEISSFEDHLLKPTLKYTNLIDQFIKSERYYSGVVNYDNPKSEMLKHIKFDTPNIQEISKILPDLTSFQQEVFHPIVSDKCQEDLCKEDKEITSEAHRITDTSSTLSEVDETEDSISLKTVKLQKPDNTILKMQQRRDSTAKICPLEKTKDYNFDEHCIAAIENEKSIVVNQLEQEETVEISSQSDTDITTGNKCNKVLVGVDVSESVPLKGSLKRVYNTIAGESDAKFLIKNVTIDDSIKYIEQPEFEFNCGNLCQDIKMTQNICRKTIDFSMSEADSDCFDRQSLDNEKYTALISREKYDDFNISTVLIENEYSSTETESTIVSAVTKIQAGARGYLARKRRLGKANTASDCKSMASEKTNQASFGSAAISESLEKLVQDSAAKKIQAVYRAHLKKRHFATDNKQEINKSENVASKENSLAQKRSTMLQRGIALHNNSSPDAGDSSSNSSKNESITPTSKVKEISSAAKSNNSAADVFNNVFEKLSPTGKTAAKIRAKKIAENKLKWFKMRQNSMPVQIDSEVLRVIPKYMSKKVKSADGEKKNSGR